MARVISFSAILALVLLSHLSVSLATINVASVLEGYKGLQLPKEPTPGYFKAFEDCAKRCLPHCARVFGDYLNGKGRSSVICCRNLVNDIRFNCHFKIAAGIMLYKQYKNQRVDILENAMELWSKCNMIVKKYGPGKPPRMI